jgi:hypothetical protein
MLIQKAPDGHIKAANSELRQENNICGKFFQERAGKKSLPGGGSIFVRNAFFSLAQMQFRSAF